MSYFWETISLYGVFYGTDLSPNLTVWLGAQGASG